MRVRCSAVVGRESELAVLSDALDRARGGAGSAVFLTGAAGIGKSAVARTVVRLAAAQGFAPLVGRAVPRPSPMPYRALTEALLTIDWEAGLPADAALAPFRPALARLVPQWRVPGEVSAEESPVVLGAGLLKLLRACAPAGSVLVLDDLHWRARSGHQMSVSSQGPLSLRRVCGLCEVHARPAKWPCPHRSRVTPLRPSRSNATLLQTRAGSNPVAVHTDEAGPRRTPQRHLARRPRGAKSPRDMRSRPITSP